MLADVYYLKRANLLRLMALFVLAAVVTLIFTRDSSVLFPQACSDYAVFRTKGLGWLQGAVPYRDLFDNKGPLHLLIQIIGHLLWPGKAGVWLLETLCVAGVLEMLFQCGRVLGVSGRLNAAAVFAGACTYAIFIDGGNCVEEWSLPFQVLTVWLALKFVRGRVRRVAPVALVFGMCFGAVAMIRLNNNGIVCGLALGVVYVLCRRHQYREIAVCAACFIAGAILAMLPFVVYFMYADACDEMVYSLLTYSIHYNAVWDNPDLEQHLENLWKLLPVCVLLPVLARNYDRHVRNSCVFPVCLGISLLTFCLFIHGPGYNHYFLMIIPMIVLCVDLSVAIKRVWKIAVLMVIMYPVWVYVNRLERRIIRPLCTKMEEAEYFRRFDSRLVALECIPVDERNNIYVASADLASLGCLLADRGHVPVGKFFFLQDEIAAVDDDVRADITRSFEKAQPLWIMADYNLFNSPLFARYATDYTQAPSHTADVWLFRRKPAAQGAIVR